jgi:predicted RNA-binding protein YlqC (UPF0109 family)
MIQRSLVEHIVKLVVNEPEAVSVDRSKQREGFVYYVRVAPGDVGKVIGKHGRVIQAIRYVVSASASKAGKKAFIKVVTPP